MAISQAAGTEIIRSASFEHVNDGDGTPLIIGVVHHIYTVLSVSIYHDTIGTSTGTYQMFLVGFDAYGGTSAQDINILKQTVGVAGSTFVWNDKYSYNGCEPDWSRPHTGPMTTAAEQTAIAAQGTTTSQVLKLKSSAGGNYFDIHITFIDQNNE